MFMSTIGKTGSTISCPREGSMGSFKRFSIGDYGISVLHGYQIASALNDDRFPQLHPNEMSCSPKSCCHVMPSFELLPEATPKVSPNFTREAPSATSTRAVAKRVSHLEAKPSAPVRHLSLSPAQTATPHCGHHDAVQKRRRPPQGPQEHPHLAQCHSYVCPTRKARALALRFRIGI